MNGVLVLNTAFILANILNCYTPGILNTVVFAIEFFTVCTKLAEMAILYSKDLTTAKKELPPVGLDLVQEINAGLGVQCLTI